MRFSSVRVLKNRRIDAFVNVAQGHFAGKSQISQLAPCRIESYSRGLDLVVVLGYNVPGVQAYPYLGALLGMIFLVVRGWTWWLLLPLSIILIPYGVNRLGIWLLRAGIRKTGYGGPIDRVSNETVMEEVLFNDAVGHN